MLKLVCVFYLGGLFVGGIAYLYGCGVGRSRAVEFLMKRAITKENGDILYPAPFSGWSDSLGLKRYLK